MNTKTLFKNNNSFFLEDLHVAITSSKLYNYSSMRIQIHLCNSIKDEAILRKVLDRIKKKIIKPFPYACRINAENNIIEEYKDNGYIGIGNKLLRLLRKEEYTNVILCISIVQTIIPMNTSSKHFYILSAVYVYLIYL